MNWNPIWNQAVTKPLAKGMMSGKNKTIVFQVQSPLDGEKIRIKFTNLYGKKAYQIGAVSIVSQGHIIPVTKDGKVVFDIQIGEQGFSDEIPVSISAGEKIEIRIYYKSKIMDCNMTEENAVAYPGDVTNRSILPSLETPDYKQKYGVYDEVVAISQIELFSENASKVIVAFGDSITAMNRWVKPLQRRLYEIYGEKYILMNAGINGNCLLYEAPGFAAESYGEKGINRFERDVLCFENLSAVIIGLGVNDVAYYTRKTEHEINFQRFTEEVTKMILMLRERGVRVIIQTLSPRKGYPQVEYTKNMEMLRTEINEWIRSTDICDYVFDADAVVRNPKMPDCYLEEFHQGDYLHPNHKGGQALADAYDLKKLTGSEM